MRERKGTKRQALIAAVLWTAATVLSLAAAVGNGSGLQALVTVLFAVNAGIWWNQYHIKKQREETNHE